MKALTIFLILIPIAFAHQASDFFQVRLQGLTDPYFLFETTSEASTFETKIKLLFKQLNCGGFTSFRDVVIVEDFLSTPDGSENLDCFNCQFGFRKIEAFCPINYNLHIYPSSGILLDGRTTAPYVISVDSEKYYFMNDVGIWKRLTPINNLTRSTP